jgi:hypothetical protein
LERLKLKGIRNSLNEGDGIHIDPTSNTENGVGNSYHFEDLWIEDCSGCGINFAGTMPQWNLTFDRLLLDHCKKDNLRILNASTVTKLTNVISERPGRGYWAFHFEGSYGTDIEMYACGGPDNSQGDQHDAPYGGGMKLAGNMALFAVRLHLEEFTGVGIELDGNVRMVLIHPLVDVNGGNTWIRWVIGISNNLEPTTIVGPRIAVSGTGNWAHGAALASDGAWPNVQVWAARGIQASGYSYDDLRVYNEATRTVVPVPVQYTAFTSNAGGNGMTTIRPAYQVLQIDYAMLGSAVFSGNQATVPDGFKLLAINDNRTLKLRGNHINCDSVEENANCHFELAGAFYLKPAIAPTTYPISVGQIQCYVKSPYYIIRYNDGATQHYNKLDLTTGIWSHSTTPP